MKKCVNMMSRTKRTAKTRVHTRAERKGRILKRILAFDFGASSGRAMLGTFSDEKTAMDELEKIFAAFEGGAKSYRI